MPSATPARLLTFLALFIGVAAVAVMVARQDAAGVARALVAMGPGVLLLPLAFLPHLVLAALSWRLLFRRGGGADFWATLRALWMGLSADTLLPVASIGGEVVKVRVAMFAGVSGTDAVTSVIVDKTVQAVSLILWGLIGLAVLAALGAGREIVIGALAGSALLMAAVVAFVAAQRAGPFGRFVAAVGRVTALTDRL
ncbi:MAG TPA: lysylphosphatidylglycerol synthase domain-containing protein, partial [Dongiaceae bacterium]|nr:lysylphosphatidylglycerol synthase domain-containing protein [Dongiaceae bacterium]